MKTISIQTNLEQYSVFIGSTIIEHAIQQLHAEFASCDRIVMVADEYVHDLYKDLVLPIFQKSFGERFNVILVPQGEKAKSMDTFNYVQEQLITLGCSRKSLLIAFGGGACGDLTGFIASTFMRGIPFIQLPTTILAHDSAVGGKTAINLVNGKNMIGTFHQPKAVIYDLNFLKSLPLREYRSGFAEVFKHALLSNEKWVNELMKINHFDEVSDLQWEEFLIKGIQVKASFVEKDEKEQNIRKFLNLGHTYGHAVEAAEKYVGLSHGECVMIGIVYVLLLQKKEQLSMDILDYATRLGYSFEAVLNYSFEELATYMLHDKKSSFGELQFVFLDQIGKLHVESVEKTESLQAHLELVQLVKERIA